MKRRQKIRDGNLQVRSLDRSPECAAAVSPLSPHLQVPMPTAVGECMACGAKYAYTRANEHSFVCRAQSSERELLELGMVPATQYFKRLKAADAFVVEVQLPTYRKIGRTDLLVTSRTLWVTPSTFAVAKLLGDSKIKTFDIRSVELLRRAEHEDIGSGKYDAVNGKFGPESYLVRQKFSRKGARPDLSPESAKLLQRMIARRTEKSMQREIEADNPGLLPDLSALPPVYQF
jgi:hypothetical protein